MCERLVIEAIFSMLQEFWDKKRAAGQDIHATYLVSGRDAATNVCSDVRA